MNQEKSHPFIGIGNAVVDILARADDDFLIQHGIEKGRMTLVNQRESAKLLRLIKMDAQTLGGSMANTISTLTRLDERCLFVGRVADDDLGRIFRRRIRDIGVTFDTATTRDDTATAHCLILVTKDAQRSMQTFLGASTGLNSQDIDHNRIANGKWLCLEGYLWTLPHSRQAIIEAAKTARDHHVQVVFSLSDAGLATQFRDSLRPFIEEFVDVLFANQDEILSLADVSDFDEAVTYAGTKTRIAALTRSEHGSVIVQGQQSWKIDPQTDGKVIDTTGAGDLYAAGFLHGLHQGRPLPVCGAIATALATEIISHFGAAPHCDPRKLIQDL